MNKDKHKQELQAWQDAVRKAQQLPRKVVWGVRIALLLLVTVWLGGALYLHSVVKEDERELARLQALKEQKEEMLRRKADYRQSVLQQQRSPNRVKNAVDGVKK